MLTVMALIPASIAIAVLRYQLLDIRLVWSRSVTYALLTASVVGIYVVLVQATDSLLSQRIGLGTSLLATVVVAAGFNPVRIRLQRAVDRRLYGDRADPLRAASAVTTQLSAQADRPEDLLPVLCQALRLPYAALHAGTNLVAGHGAPPQQCARITLSYGDGPAGDLEVGLRPGERHLDPRDRAVLELVAARRRTARHVPVTGPAAVAARARDSPRGGTAPVAPRPARRPRPGPHRTGVPGRRRRQPRPRQPRAGRRTRR
jgi:type III secretory pathway component EscS